MLALDDSAIAASKERMPGASRFEVHVSRLEATQALRAMRALGKLDPPQQGFSELYPEPSLVPTPSEERGRIAQAAAGELAHSLERLPNALRARVHVGVPEATALDAPRPAWSASILIERRASTAAIDEASIRALVSGALRDIAATDIRIVQVEALAQRARTVTRVGPFSVATSSASQLKGVLAGALALNTALACGMIALVARKRRQS